MRFNYFVLQMDILRVLSTGNFSHLSYSTGIISEKPVETFKT
jgi:hypothetical protein